MKNLSRVICTAAAFALTLPLGAQLPSNASLNGAYFVNYLGADISTISPSPFTFQGIVTFDGKGNYALTGQGTTVANCQSAWLGVNCGLTFSHSGSYEVWTSGIFEMRNPFDSSGNTWMRGGISIGPTMIVASSDYSTYGDFLVAIPVNTTASNGTLNGKYYVAALQFHGSGGSPDLSMIRNTFFPLVADGKGGLGDVTVSGTGLDLNNAPTTQVSSSATYAINADGSGTLTLPDPAGVATLNQLLAGEKALFVSPDGGFFMASSATGYDLILGVKATSGSTPGNSFQGIYWGMALNLYNPFPATQTPMMDSYTGAANEIPSSKLEVADWAYTSEGGYGNDLTQRQNLAFAADGTESDAQTYGALGANGSIAIMANNGSQGHYGLAVRLKAPSLSGPGVFLNPQGVVNAASSTPFTTQLSPGEFITLYGSGLASQTAMAASLPFPAKLGGVQVTINGAPAPLYYVSPTQISAIVPYALDATALAAVQVINNGTASNIVKMFSGQTSPGVFTIPAGGIGNGAIVHADYRLVSASSPAKVGETVIMFLTGLGAVSPAVTEGATAPANPLSMVADANFEILIDRTTADIPFAGLAPGLAGLYQVNFTIPSDVSAGELEIITTDSISQMIRIPISQ